MSEEIEAWDMWIYKQHGILPIQYHHFYNQGETILYPEHLQDLLTIDKMWNNRLQKERHKEQSKQQLKQNNNPLNNNNNRIRGIGEAGGLNSNFYGKKFVYKK